MPDVLLKIEHNIGFINLNRPEVLNSFNREMALLLQESLDICSGNNIVRAIVISGNGKAFCAGQDLKEVGSKESGVESLTTNYYPAHYSFRKILEEHYNPIIKKNQKHRKTNLGSCKWSCSRRWS